MNGSNTLLSLFLLPVFAMKSHKEKYKQIKASLPAGVTLLAAVKTQEPAVVSELIDAGVTDIGHNYVQEAERMYQQLGEKARKVRWHLIGPLQKNKINRALKIFDVIQTVDSIKKAEQIAHRAQAMERFVDVFIEVNSGNEVQKAGVTTSSEIYDVAKRILALSSLHLKGLMTMGPLFTDAEDMRPFYQKLRASQKMLLDSDLFKNQKLELSMGMSSDYRVAIEEGATMVRLGSILFGRR